MLFERIDWYSVGTVKLWKTEKLRLECPVHRGVQYEDKVYCSYCVH